MQKQCFTIFILIVLLVLCAANAPAQQSTSAAENNQSVDEALREKAFDLLKSLANQLSTLQSAENRARIGANIAESLWIHDEKRARDLLTVVAEDIRAGLRPHDSLDVEARDTFWAFLKLRADTIERIAKHDPELAFAFFNATQLASEPYSVSLLYEVREQEMELAKQIARSTPNLALELARRSLRREFTPDLRELLSKLNTKHKEQALVLYKEIVRKLDQTDLAEDESARSFALNLVMTFRPPAADESTFRELVGLFIKAAVANGCTKSDADESEDLCRVVGVALPHITKIDPVRAARLKQWEVQSHYSERPSPPPDYELQSVIADGSVEEIQAFASQYPVFQQYIFQSAVTKARDSGDVERARKIASEFKGNPETRRAMLAQFDAAEVSVNDEKLEEAQEDLREITRPSDRVLVLLSLANRVGSNNRKAALKLLDQASESIALMKPGLKQDEAQSRLAMLYCLHRSDRGLAIMESMVPKLNELVAAAAKLNGYGTRYLREGEWNMTAEGQPGGFLTTLAAHAGYFAWSDFDRAVSLAEQFERSEIRMMAQLKLAQGILAGRPKRLHLGMINY